jgi:hypothetical protein
VTGLVEMLKGPTGSFDVQRIGFAIGTAGMVIAPIVFQAVALFKGQVFSAAEFCGGYGVGLGSLGLAGGFGIAAKDKGVASALNTTAPMPPEGGQP